MTTNPKVDTYIDNLPDWQKAICIRIRELIHKAEPDIVEEIKFTNRPYFTLNGNVAAFLAAKDHVNIFIYDPIAPDPKKIINQGDTNATARSIQLYEGDMVDEKAFVELIQAVVSNNRSGGWRHLKPAGL